MRARRPRLPVDAYVGSVAASLTFCTSSRRSVFTDSRIVDPVWTQILRAAEATDVEILAYCFIPDHLHLVVQTTHGAADVSRFVRLAKQLSAYGYSRQTGTRLWQPSWHDRLFRQSDDLVTIVRYVLANPIRAGLVSDTRAYPYVGSGIMSRRDELLDSVFVDRQA